jgi:hypothetical protein
MGLNVVEAIAKLLDCESGALQDYLNHPTAQWKANEFLNGKTLRTTYANRKGEKDDVKFGRIGQKSSDEQMAYENFLKVTGQRSYKKLEIEAFH